MRYTSSAVSLHKRAYSAGVNSLAILLNILTKSFMVQPPMFALLSIGKLVANMHLSGPNSLTSSIVYAIISSPFYQVGSDHPNMEIFMYTLGIAANFFIVSLYPSDFRNSILEGPANLVAL